MAKMKKNSKAEGKASGQRRAREARLLNITAIALGSILVGLILWICAREFTKSDWFKQHVSAVNVDGEKITITDYNFYFYRSYYEFLNNVGKDETGMYSSPQSDTPLSEQYMDEENDVTWQDYFDDRAESLIRETYAFYHLAQDAGFTLTEEMQDDIDYDYEEKIWFESVEVGGSTEEEYLEENYGSGMTRDIYIKNLTILYTAKFYKEYYRENLEITPEELDAYYAENASDYRCVFYQLFYLYGGEDGMEEARLHAEELAKCSTLEEFEQKSEEYMVYNTEDSYWTEASELHREYCWTSISYLRDWLSAERAYGDTTVAKATNGYYVAFFRESSDNDYQTVNLKYFTVSGSDAYDEVHEFLDSFAESDGTVQTFFDLSDDVRDKDYSRSDNRKISSITYDNATIQSVPEKALEWAFDESRKTGDVTSVHADDEWYILYFDGFDELASRIIADDKLRTERYNAWTEEVQSDISYVKCRFFEKTAAR